MKRILIFIAILAFSSSMYHAMAIPQECENASANGESPQVCQFSLSKYTGTIQSDGYTGPVKVGLSCPQTDVVYATVIVVIDNDIVASKVVEIPANKTESGSVDIYVGSDYAGKKFKLGVQ